MNSEKNIKHIINIIKNFKFQKISNIFFETGYILLANVSASALTFFGSIFIIRTLSVNDYGAFSAFINFVTIISGIILGGLNTSIIRYISTFLKNPSDLQKAQALARNLLKIEILISTFLIIISFLFNKQISLFLFGKPEMSYLVKLLGINSFVIIISSFTQTILQTLQRFKQLAFIIIGQSLINFICIMLLTQTKLISPASVILSGIFASIAILPWGFLKIKSFLILKNPQIKLPKKMWREIFHYTKWITIASVAIFLFLKLDILMLTTLTNLETVGRYAFANAVYVNLLLFLSAINTILLPKISQLQSAVERFTNAKKIFVISIFLSLCLIPFLFLIKPVLLLLFGTKYLSSFPILYIMLIGLICSIAMNPVINFVYILKKEKVFAINSILFLILHIVGNFIFIPKFDAYGAVVVTTIAIIFSNITLTIIVFKQIKKDLKYERSYTEVQL